MALLAIFALTLLFPASLLGCAASTGADPTRIDLGAEAERLAEARRLAVKAQQKTDDPDQAIALYRQAVSAYPDLAAAWNNLGALLLDQERYLDAAEAFAAAADNSQADPRPLYNLGLTWERAGYLADAVEHYSHALDRDPRYLPALRGALRAQIYLGQATPEMLDQLRLTIAMETNPRWRQWLQDQRSVVQQRVYSQTGANRPGPIRPDPNAEPSPMPPIEDEDDKKE